jgi:hypothetical protein
MPYFSNIIPRLHSPGLISSIVTLQSWDCTFIPHRIHVGDEAIGGCAENVFCSRRVVDSMSAA